jgi:hypothetical protein
MDDKISLKCIHDLLNYHFVIPSYQRGYRWTDQQVNDLLDDVWEFTQKGGKAKDEFYCLQPVVVALDRNRYSVIDGQQRLITIYIIFSVLKDIKRLIEGKNFTIEFETRKDSGKFLQNINLTRIDDNIDYYHICRAFETIERWFASKPGTVRVDFLNSLLRDDKSGNNVKVIWYEIDSTMDPIDIFTRINMGKIPLTNAELVKALFLKRENFEGDENFSRLRQLELATEWDNIEYSLRSEEFWYFLTNSQKNYESRIEFIFDLIAGTSPTSSLDKYYTFRHFNQQCNGPAAVETIWQGIKNYFLTFSEWFDIRKYYHLVGYLIALGEDLGELKDHSSAKTKSEFEQYLMEKIRMHVRCSIDELNYYEDGDKIRKVLLLFNIITLLDSINSNERFQFGRYKIGDWDIEHIHAVQSEMPSAAIHQNDWLKEVFKFTDNIELKNRISRYINTAPELRNEIFETLYNDVVKFYSESELIEDIQDISNLALLDSGTNRGLRNAVFPIKRKVIIEKDRGGLFLPLCTRNVFLKYYSDKVEQMTFWGKADRQAYLGAIKQTLARFIND